MGNKESFIQRICNKFYKNTEIRVLMCGLDAAGKTTILYKLKLGDVVTTIPTIGFNVETVSYKNINFTAWDVGGRSNIRPLWRHYYQKTDVLIFVVDSNDRERMEECRDELDRFLCEDELKNCCVLVLANKQDLPNAMTLQEVTERLDLNKLPPERTWHIQASCATSGDGLYEGLSWLKSTLSTRQAKKSASKPTAEVKDSLTGKIGILSSWLPSISNYFTSANITTHQ